MVGHAAVSAVSKWPTFRSKLGAGTSNASAFSVNLTNRTGISAQKFHIHSLDLARNLGSGLCISLASRALRYQKLVVANEALVILTNLWEIQD